MSITPLPTVPQRSDGPTVFADRADTFLAALPTFASEAGALEINVNAKEASTVAAAAIASVAAAAAAAAAGAIAWVSGTTYAIGDARYSPIDLQTYRRKIAGAGTTDPSADATNWARLALPAAVPVVARASNTIITASDMGKMLNLSGTWTQTFSAASALGSGWSCYIRNTGSGNIELDPNASELIDGATTYALKPGFSILLTCNGTSFGVFTLKARKYDYVEHAASTTWTVPADTYVIRPYAFGAGGTGTGAQSGGGGGCAYGDVAVTPGEVVTLTISAGVATVTTAGVVRVTGNPASGMTAGTASKHASVTNGGAYSGGAGLAGARYGGASSGSPLGTGYAGHFGGGGGWGGAGGGDIASGGGGVGGPGLADRQSGGGLAIPSTDPLLAGLDSPGVPYMSSGAATQGINGGPGAGGGCYGGVTGGKGGTGGGGGCGVSIGGGGGFGGGGGGCTGANAGGAGGYGGGGGAGVSGPLPGGGAVIRIYY